jgi:DNA-binding response OmpR family regulator
VRRIFLIEDDVYLCAMLAKMLKFEGIDTIIAHDGDAAKRILEGLSGTIDAILCDITMPGMDGYEFLEYANRSKLAAVPFIFMSACVSKEEESRGLTMGARAFLKKPVSITLILDTVYPPVKS